MIVEIKFDENGKVFTFDLSYEADNMQRFLKEAYARCPELDFVYMREAK